MKCPYCAFIDSKVVDSRPSDEGAKVRRRRECLGCAKRFTTYEVVETAPILVIKKDKSREMFDSEKLLRGMLLSSEKRPISRASLEQAVDQIQAELLNSMDQEITSSQIGALVMDKLKDIDEVAYIRFASVYRDFKDVDSFMKELKALLESREENE